MPVVGVTDAGVDAMRTYLDAGDYTFPVLADAEPTREAWGVGMIWGNVVRLVAPDGTVVAEHLDGAARILGER